MPVLIAIPPPNPGFELLVSSQGMSQGLLLTEGPQVFPRVFVQIGTARVGAQWRNVDSRAANGVAAVFLKSIHKVRKAEVEIGVTYRVRTGLKGPSDPDSWEFNFASRRTFGKLGIRLNADYSPQDFGGGRSLYVELGPTIDVGRNAKLSLGLGRREREQNHDYSSFNVGLTKVLTRHLSLDTRYHTTSRAGLGSAYQQRVILAARLAL